MCVEAPVSFETSIRSAHRSLRCAHRTAPKAAAHGKRQVCDLWHGDCRTPPKAAKTTHMNLQTYPQAFRPSGTSWPSSSRRALINKENGGWRGNKVVGGGRDKTKVYTDRAQRPLAVDLAGQPDLRNTLWGLLLDLSLTPIKGSAVESCPAAPQTPHIYVCFGGSLAPTVNQWSACSVKAGHSKETGGRGNF